MCKNLLPAIVLTVSAIITMVPQAKAQGALVQQPGLDVAVAAVRANPNDLGLRRCLAVALIRKGLTVKAAEQLRGMLSLEAPNADDEILLGDAYRYSGDNQNAIRSYRTALCINPMSSKARSGLSLSYAAAGDLKSAYDICQNGLAQLVDKGDRKELSKTLTALRDMSATTVASTMTTRAY